MRLSCYGFLVLIIAICALPWTEAQPTFHPHQKIQSLMIYPTQVTIKAGESIRFTAIATDMDQMNFTPKNLSWFGTGGTIDSEGRYFAGEQTGNFMVTAQAYGIQATAVIRIKGYGYNVVRVQVAPKHSRLRPGETAQFEAVAYDTYGNTVPTRFHWETDGGTIDHRGFFTAGHQSGRFRISAREMKSGMTDEVAVNIIGHDHHPDPIPPDPYPTQGRIVVTDVDTGGNFLQPKIKMTVQVFGQGAATLRLFSVSSDGRYNEIDSQACRHGETVSLKGRFENFSTRFFEVRLFDNMNRLMATQRKNR